MDNFQFLGLSAGGALIDPRILKQGVALRGRLQRPDLLGKLSQHRLRAVEAVKGIGVDDLAAEEKPPVDLAKTGRVANFPP